MMTDTAERHPLELTPDEVARLTRPHREWRVLELMTWGFDFINEVKAEIEAEGKEVVGVLAAYSGGNDSTTLVHAFRPLITHAGHANTGIGIEETRQFVRDTCADWDIPLIEKHPPAGSTFRELVLDQGFPGPAHHWKMYQRLKERAFRQIRNELVTRPRNQRLIVLAGRRRTESDRRANIPLTERVGSMVWISPMAYWTKLDLVTYRLMHRDVPRNKASDTIHMSGECLCGAFAKPQELEEIGDWFPEVRAEIEALEAEVLATGKHPEWKCRWGWGADKALIEQFRKEGYPDDEIASLFTRSKSGIACSTCDASNPPILVQ